MGVDYTHLSKTYDSYRSFPDELHARVVELGSIGEGATVLDIGCGTGNAAARLRHSRRAAVIGMDRSPEMLRKALAKDVPVVLADADGRYLPFCDSSFRAVLGVYVIHHIQNLPSLLSECHRVLRDGILLLLTSSYAQIEHQHPAVKQFFPSFVSMDIARFPNIPEVDGLLEGAGFDAIEHSEVAIDSIPLDEAFLEKVKNKYISTYELIPEDEFRSGVQGLETYIRGLKRPEFREWRATLIRASM